MQLIFRSSLFIVISLLAGTIHATTLLEDLQYTNVTNYTIPGLGDIQCFNNGLLDRRRAQRHDCVEATYQFPYGIVRGNFYRGGDSQYELFALPRNETYKSCTVIVDLQYVRFYESYWLIVQIAITQIILSCTSGKRMLTGGRSTLGPHGELSLRVQRAGSVSEEILEY